MNTSKHLDDIIERQNHTSNVQVVFFDIERYSKRRTINQISVIKAFTECLKKALQSFSTRYVEYAQKNDLNFKTDIVSIPTGDGAAVALPFEGLPDAHLDFAREVLRGANERRSPECFHFVQQGWCNCHDYFNLRVGISEGKGVFFKDLNGNYNVAGNVINLASRVMQLAGRNQVMLTADAYRQVIDMNTEPKFLEEFVEFCDVPIKHGERISVFQYIGKREAFLNASPPEDLQISLDMRKAMQDFRPFGLDFPNMDEGPDGRRKFLNVMQVVMSAFGSPSNLKPAVPGSTISLPAAGESLPNTGPQQS